MGRRNLALKHREIIVERQCRRRAAVTEVSQFQTLFSYSFDTTQRLLASARELNETDLHENPGYGRGSIHDLFFHLLATLRGWRLGLESGHQPDRIEEGQFPDLDALQQMLEEERSAWQVYLDALDAESIDSDVELTTRHGMKRTFPRWRILQHLLLHGMQHHAELARLLTTHGRSPGDIDFIFYQ
jgi:uncharacterized damage-inducible protein DinB